MSGFYRVPRYIYDPIRNSNLIEGRVLLPFDPTGELAEQVKADCVSDIQIGRSEEDIVNLEWWQNQKQNVDWVIAITQGMKDYTKWITECGLQVATRGVCILDRLTFLEPTRAREDFLQEASLTNIKILSPRPAFRADGKQLKDSVTSAWFTFKKPGEAQVSTTIDYEVGWLHPKNLKR